MVYIGFMWPFLLVARRSNARLVFLQMLILPICQHVYMPGSAKHQVYFADRVEGEDGESTVSPIFFLSSETIPMNIVQHAGFFWQDSPNR